MSNIPVWALGYGLRAAGVPCAEEVAMMLGRKKPDPVLKLETDFLAFRGIAGAGARYTGSYGGTTPVPKPYTSTFEKGEFPSILYYTYDMYGYKNYVPKGEGTIPIVLENTAEVLQTKTGDQIHIKYLFPWSLTGTIHSEAISYGNSPKTFTIDFYLDSASGVNGGKTARYKYSTTGNHDGISSFTPKTPTFGNVDNSTYCPMLKKANLKSVTTDWQGITRRGFELTGELLHPVDKISIDITGDFGYTNRCLRIVARCNTDDLQVSIYE